MLKALELVGFKSFADKTRFEFPQGITTVVGPNGSGKSNVVDAIKWVLGEQSVKSLRGKEMADVIFNGSGSRHALNAAEATLTFDNPGRVLPIDTAEVHITRRVYRNGEGEYLINRQPCRLRDIRDLFSGTGVATEAYSVIEQGKVDVMLQASPRDRRAIFEEAAGISRFKAKKIETLRRLERVDQNLLRLSDIVEEVDNRLRSVRMQAAKARRYKEHTDRLQQLRTQVGLVDWRKLSARLAGLESEAGVLADQRDQAAAQAESLEAQALQLETALADQAELIRASEAAHAENGREIATHEAAIQHQRARVGEAEEEVARHMRQLAAMSVKAGDLEQQLRETSAAVREADEQHTHRKTQLASREQSLAELAAALAEMRAEYERDRGQCLEATRAAAALASEVQSLEAQVQAARGERSRHVERLSELDEARQALAGELNQLARRQQELVEAVDRRGAEWSHAQARLAELRHQQQARQAELARLRQRESGAAERSKLLDELEQRQEGLGAGVRQVLAEARKAADGPFRHVRGLVADLFHVSVEMAPLIEAALGEWAQYFVVSQDDELVALVERETYHFQGRVGFIRLAERDPAGWEKPADLEGQPGVQGRADHFVDTPAELAPLARRLLGRTWIVEKLSHARALAEGMGRGLSFVTLAGEVLAADGTLSVGPRYAATGLMSRRSELRALKQQLAQLASAIRDESAALTELDRQMAAEAERCQALAAEHQRAADALGEHRLRVQASQGRHQQIGEQSELLTVQLDEVSQRLAAAGSRLEQSRQRLAEVEDRLCRLQAADTAIAEQMAELETRRQQCQREATAAKVELAKSEERLSNLQGRLRQFDDDQQERRRTIAECRAQLAQCRQRARQSQQAILAAESQVAQLYLAKEGLAARTVVLINGREAQRRSRADLVARAQAARASARQFEERQHAKELAANEVRHERSALADRLREDYGVELAELAPPAGDEQARQRDEVDREIAELRRKINNIGNVNLDALAELDELESRHASLSAQYDDLVKAKDSLAQIIGRINADSRRLFCETLQTVKGHFQGLFRKLFGGGQADIILEEGVDILDSGIEIVARPPGKEPRSISLLSGGEKTLTCVALLLAIFQYRPSPFCVLDEVDASLDEANIERFIAVLQEFLAWTQFIVVTHSKKTMTCATTLYGVTMQESGVSKRVSVRFDDVSDNGEIRLPDRPADPAEEAAA